MHEIAKSENKLGEQKSLSKVEVRTVVLAIGAIAQEVLLSYKRRQKKPSPSL
jgi:hypothetical protein